jgi:hypothetical protein
MSNNYYEEETATPTFVIVPYDYGLVIKEGLFAKLYMPQLKYWNDRLRNVSDRNLAAHAREQHEAEEDRSHDNFVGVFFDGITLGLLPYDEDDDPVSPFCLELYTSDPDLVKDCKVVAQEITKLSIERYESQRFMAGLAMFDVPPQELVKILGDGLGDMCHAALSESGYKPEILRWDVKEPVALKTFIDEHKDIITSMQERVLLNMITI